MNAPPPPMSRLPLSSICLGFFIVMLDTTIVNVALADMGRDLGVGVTSLQWVVAGYTLAFGALLLTAGAVSDMVGAHRFFQIGLVSFAVTSAACAAAPNSAVLVAFRIAQGAAAAMLVPTSLALINATYAERSQRARAIGVWGGMGGIAAAAGPALGGVLIAAVNWRLVFLVNIPVCVLAIVLVRRFVPGSPGSPARRLDLGGQVLGIGSLALLSYGLIQGSADGWSSEPAFLLLAGLVILMCFAVFELRRPEPMFPVRLMAIPSFASALATGLVLNFGFYGQLFVLSLYFQVERHHSPLVTGLLLVPQTATAIVGSTLGGRVNARTGPSTPIMIGLLVGAAGFAGLLVVGDDTAYLTLLGPMIAGGLGTAFTMPAATSAAVEAAPPGRAGAASGAVNAARQIGSVLGVAILGGFVAADRSFVSGFHAAVLGAAALFLAGFLLNLALVGRRVRARSGADGGGAGEPSAAGGATGSRRP